ncbi:hypothetical protein TARUN_1310 [Trichoderma arundinaceum]|uniref:Small acidic protein-like domain-containing protein n=1 Tax=Trichoderma arundinaceum TaxID=490622 RepID=A0A395NY02_TRIAR|nr:hypothetical protein TARUN_1310 [Trichoderma arundinaceum]
MGSSATNAKADAPTDVGQGKILSDRRILSIYSHFIVYGVQVFLSLHPSFAERKLEKQARKAERKAERKAKKLAKLEGKEAHPAGQIAAEGREEKKENPALEKQLLDVEKKRHHYLALSEKLETEAKQLLKQAEDAAKKYQQMTKALEVQPPIAKALYLILDDQETFGSSDGQDVDVTMQDATGSSEAASKPKADVNDVAPEKKDIKEQETKGEEKKKKKEKKKKSNDVEVADVEEQAEEKHKKKKKSKSKSDEGNGAKEPVPGTPVDVADSKRKRQDDNAEEPVSKKGKKEKKSKGGEQALPATTEEFKIEGLEGGSARQDKYLRLLGGKKAGAGAAKLGSLAVNKGDSVRAEAALERQYQAGMLLKESGHKRRGLGA